MKPKLRVPPREHFKQAIKYEAAVSIIRKWRSRDGHFAISEVTNEYEPARFLLIRITDGCEYIVDRRRTLRAAVASWKTLQPKGTI